VVQIAPEQGTERLRQAIEDPATTEVTVSIGVATQASDESWHQVLRRADQALYSAKHSGRNQVQLS